MIGVENGPTVAGAEVGIVERIVGKVCSRESRQIRFRTIVLPVTMRRGQSINEGIAGGGKCLSRRSASVVLQPSRHILST